MLSCCLLFTYQNLFPEGEQAEYHIAPLKKKSTKPLSYSCVGFNLYTAKILNARSKLLQHADVIRTVRRTQTLSCRATAEVFDTHRTVNAQSKQHDEEHDGPECGARQR